MEVNNNNNNNNNNKKKERNSDVRKKEQRTCRRHNEEINYLIKENKNPLKTFISCESNKTAKDRWKRKTETKRKDGTENGL